MTIKRTFDFFTAFFLLVLLIPPNFFIALAVKLTSTGPVLFWSNRVGINNQKFSMPKFRTMKVDCPVVATNLLASPNDYLTPVGSFLRRFSLDEIPQLWSIFKGDMSFVGPRPALYNQYDLIALRNKKGIQKIIPGLTGLAQINGRDNLTIEEKVNYDFQYMQNFSLYLDTKIIFITFVVVLNKKNIKF